MSVSALSSHLLPTTNKRNAALIQKHMEEALGVSPARGLLRFVATNEENMAHNGKTMAGEIEELERSYSRSPTPMMTDEKAETTPKAARMRKKLSVRVSVTDQCLGLSIADGDGRALRAFDHHLGLGRQTRS